MEDPAKVEKKIKVEVVKEEEQKSSEEKNLEENSTTSEAKLDQNSHKQEVKEKTYRQKTPFWVLFLVFLLGLTLGAGLIGGIFYYKLKVEKISLGTTKETPQPSPELKETPTPQPEEVRFSDLKVLILNGSGIKGEAGKVEELVKKAGFEKTETGNADSYNYQDTSVFLKEGLPDSVYEKISQSLASYSLKKESLEKNSAYDIKIIVGKTKK